MTLYTPRHALAYPTGSDTAGITPAEFLASNIEEKLDQYRSSNGSRMLHSIGMYQENLSNLPGWVVIETPVVSATSDKMVRLDVRGFDYLGHNNIIDCTVYFYSFSDTLIYPEFNNAGTMQFKDVMIIKNIGSGRLALALRPDRPSSGDYWQNPKIVVDAWYSFGTEFQSYTANYPLSIGRYPTTPIGSGQPYTHMHTFTASAQWAALPLINGWVNYDSSVGSNVYTQAQYRKVNGIVQLRGLIKDGSNQADVATLPPGFRPQGGFLIFPAASGVTNVGNSWGRLDVHPNGAVICRGQSGTVWTSLNQITFPAMA